MINHRKRTQYFIQNFWAKTATNTDLQQQQYITINTDDTSTSDRDRKVDSRVEISDRFSPIPCSNCIYNRIHFPPSCICTPGASDSNIKGAVLKLIVFDSFVVLYIVVVYHRCCCAYHGFDDNKQDDAYMQSIHLQQYMVDNSAMTFAIRDINVKNMIVIDDGDGFNDNDGFDDSDKYW